MGLGIGTGPRGNYIQTGADGVPPDYWPGLHDRVCFPAPSQLQAQQFLSGAILPAQGVDHSVVSTACVVTVRLTATTIGSSNGIR
jgi:hypothetical protein